MKMNSQITNQERSYLRELAKKQLEYSALPVMAERTKLWYAHNALHGARPVIVMEMDTFEGDLLPELKCQSAQAREMEQELLRHIVNHELVGDDKVVPPFHTVYWDVRSELTGVKVETERAEDGMGRSLGYRQTHPLRDLKEDMHLLKPSVFSVDREGTFSRKALAEDVFGDILPVKLKNRSLRWFFAPTAAIVTLMGMEAMLYSMIDYPDEFHELMQFLENDNLNFARWQQSQGLLGLNNENDYVGSGSYGFTTELPRGDRAEDGEVTLKDQWVNMNSQESVGVSPAMYGEFIFPYYSNVAKEAGMVYYGCCEPVHEIWQKYLSTLQGIRKVSISAWSNEDIMGEALKGSGVIYSRKPSPNFIGVGRELDEEGFKNHIAKSLLAAKGCKMEFIFRDVYTLSGNTAKAARAVELTREMIAKYY